MQQGAGSSRWIFPCKHTLGELVRVSLQGVHLAKSTFPASCLPLQAGNIAKMFEITRGTLQHALATKLASQANFDVMLNTKSSAACTPVKETTDNVKLRWSKCNLRNLQTAQWLTMCIM
jgi:hypothetical protein